MSGVRSVVTAAAIIVVAVFRQLAPAALALMGDRARRRRVHEADVAARDPIPSGLDRPFAQLRSGFSAARRGGTRR